MTLTSHLVLFYIFFLAIIITGGWLTQTVEVLRSNGSRWCSLADLPEYRYEHTQSGLTLCGGKYDLKNCLTFNYGNWAISHTGLDHTTDHSAWSSAIHGTRLLGDTSTELLADNGETPRGYSLKDFTS